MTLQDTTNTKYLQKIKVLIQQTWDSVVYVYV